MTEQPARILLVDDDRQTRLKLARDIEGAGYSVSSAESGGQALEMIRSQSFDLILLDILMPEIDGFQVLETLQADPILRDIPIIVISAMDDQASSDKCLALGAKAFLTKPVDPDRLNASIEQNLKQ